MQRERERERETDREMEKGQNSGEPAFKGRGGKKYLAKNFETFVPPFSLPWPTFEFIYSCTGEFLVS